MWLQVKSDKVMKEEGGRQLGVRRVGVQQVGIRQVGVKNSTTLLVSLLYIIQYIYRHRYLVDCNHLGL